MNDRVTFRLGPLAEPLAAACHDARRRSVRKPDFDIGGGSCRHCGTRLAVQKKIPKIFLKGLDPEGR